MKEDKIKNRIIKQSFADDSWMDEILEDNSKSHYLHHSSAIATEILLELRRRKMSQTDLANQLSVSPQYINKIVKGKENLTLDTIGKIERELGVSLISVPSSEKKKNDLRLLFESAIFKNSAKAFVSAVSYSPIQTFKLQSESVIDSTEVKVSYLNNYYEKIKSKAIQRALERFEKLKSIRENSDLNYFEEDVSINANISINKEPFKNQNELEYEQY